MRIDHIEINGFLGLRHAQFDTATAPVNLIAGHNRVGKSTVRDALRFAFTGDPGRVSLKKEYGSLLSDGAKSGTIRVDTDDGALLRQVEDGKRANIGDGWDAIDTDALGPTLPLVIDADTFARQRVDERRRQLFAIAGIDIAHVDVTERLQRRGLTGGAYEDILDDALRYVRVEGFDGAHTYCRGQAREAKGRWRQVTGETYGAKKAEGWQPASADFDEANHEKLVAQRDRLEARVGEMRERVGELRARAENTVDEAERQGLEETAGKLAARQQFVADTERKLKRARTEQAEADAQAKADAAAKREKEQAESKAQQEKQAAEARAADQAHRERVNIDAATGINEALSEYEGIDDMLALDIVSAIAAGDIPHVSISY